MPLMHRLMAARAAFWPFLRVVRFFTLLGVRGEAFLGDDFLTRFVGAMLACFVPGPVSPSG